MGWNIYNNDNRSSVKKLLACIIFIYLLFYLDYQIFYIFSCFSFTTNIVWPVVLSFIQTTQKVLNLNRYLKWNENARSLSNLWDSVISFHIPEMFLWVSIFFINYPGVSCRENSSHVLRLHQARYQQHIVHH